MNNILVLCVGNICRSPLAGAMFKQPFPEKKICSAGLAALVGQPADDMAIKVPKAVGHAAGAKRVRGLIQAYSQRGISCITLFAFSTENWKRPAEEVTGLIALLLLYEQKEASDMSKKVCDLKALVIAVPQNLACTEPVFLGFCERCGLHVANPI